MSIIRRPEGHGQGNAMKENGGHDKDGAPPTVGFQQRLHDDGANDVACTPSEHPETVCQGAVLLEVLLDNDGGRHEGHTQADTWKGTTTFEHNFMRILEIKGRLLPPMNP